MKLLKKLYKVYSPSGKERAMIKFIWNYTKRITGTKVETDAVGNLYITKGEAESYPCIVGISTRYRGYIQKISRLLKREKLYSVTAPGIKDRKDSEPMTRTESG